MTRSRETPIRVAVSGSCATAHAAAEFGSLDEEFGGNGEQDRGKDDDDRGIGDCGIEDGEQFGRPHQHDRLLGVGTAETRPDLRQYVVHDLPQNERHADRRDQKSEPLGTAFAQWPIGDPLQSDRGAAGDQHADHHGRAEIHDRQSGALRVDVSAGPETEQHQSDQLTEHAQHEYFRMGEIDEAQYTVNQGVAHRDQSVDRTIGETVDGEPPELVDHTGDIEIDGPVRQQGHTGQCW